MDPSILQSKFPDQETTIFTIMSRMALDHGAINLSQGFPDFKVSAELVDLVHEHMQLGHNQYAPMQGEPILRQNISQKALKTSGYEFDPDTEIIVTAGATEAIYAAITALIHPGDEVVIFEPAYDLYVPCVELNGGKVVPVKLALPDFSVDWDRVEKAITGRTRLIVVNTPHNPTGSILRHQDLLQLAVVAEKYGLIVLSDEAYEHIIFDGEQHCSVLNYPELQERSIAVFSFGKTFHATGWKMGYSVAPDWLTDEIRKVHQWVNFSINTPIQHAIAEYLADEDHYQNLGSFYQEKRDRFADLMKGSRFEPIPSKGTYFYLFSYRKISEQNDRDLAASITKEHGVASIPISVFYSDRQDDHILRFCFAKNDETLRKGAEVLCKI